MRTSRSLNPWSTTTTALLVTASLLTATQGSAFQFKHGELEGSIDTTLSIGVSSRLKDPDRSLYGIAAGGLQNSVNYDDGNLNYKKGIYSFAAKGTTDLQLQFQQLRAFVRTTYLYDFESQDGARARTPLSDDAQKKVGRYVDLLDAFVAGKFDLGGRPAELRVGNEVLSWGESTFIQNGINVVNPIDVSHLRGPGSELKDALLPVPMISGSFGLSDNVSVEAFYQLAWRKTEIDPPGTYFGSNDFAGAGGNKVYLGFGAIPDSTPYGFISRGPDKRPSNSGQFGLAAHMSAPGLGDTEFGLYVIRYHSRLPMISALTPTRGVSAAEVQATAGSLAQTNLAPALIAGGIPTANVPASLTTLVGAALLGYPASVLPASLQPYFPAAQSIANSAKQLGFFSAAATGNYVIEYPEDITLLGASFNTDLAKTGISLQGEVSYKSGVPLQLDDVELLFAALSSLNPAFGPNNQLGNYLGRYATRIPGWKRKDVWQAQMTGTKVFGPMLGASQWLLIGEVGATMVPDLQDKNVLRYDGPGTFTSGSASEMALTGNGAFPTTPLSMFADKFSSGYQIAARFDYNNVFWNLNMSPSLAFSHDVSGVTPLPLGNFIEGRKSLTTAVEFTYQNKWTFEARYVSYFGGGAANLISDRDFVAAVIKYSF